MEAATIDALTGISLSTWAGGLGSVAAVLATCVCHWSLRACGVTPGWRSLAWGIVAGLLTAGLAVAILFEHCQDTPEVRPTVLWWQLRPAFYGLLIVLLIAATATDLQTYYILDAVTLSGMLLAVLIATLAGELQLCHVWVDWNAEIPQLRGPYIPDWLAAHPHAHGLAWSVAGLVVGGGLTWAARSLSSLLLGQEALGFGDVTLMGMIGAFTGWQAVLIVFLIAPLCALATGLIVRLCSSKTYVPYGPYLALAALLVLFNWRAIWMFELPLAAAPGGGGLTFALRRLFGDATGLLILAGLSTGGLVLMLGAWRLYRALPVRLAAEEPPPIA